MSQEEIGAWVGIDWADKEHRIVLEEAATGRRVWMAVGQSAEELHEWLTGLRSRYMGRRVAMALEQSRGALFYVLNRYEFIDLYPVNPKTLARYRDALRPSGAKDDPDDAALVLELLLRHRDRLRLWKADDARTRQLRLLVEYRRKLVDDRTALLNQLTQPSRLSIFCCDGPHSLPSGRRARSNSGPSTARTPIRPSTSRSRSMRSEQPYRSSTIRPSLQLAPP